MTRPDFTHALEARLPYLTLCYQKIPGEASWTLLEQARTLSTDITADNKEYSRIGDKNKLQIAGTAAINITLHLYYENSIAEVARALGHVIPGGGWAGTEEIDMDPTFVADYMMIDYDGVDLTASVPLFVTYINQFKPNKLTSNKEAEGDAMIAEIAGSAVAWYLAPLAGVGA